MAEPPSVKTRRRGLPPQANLPLFFAPLPRKKSFLAGLSHAFRKHEPIHDDTPTPAISIESTVRDDVRTAVQPYIGSVTDRVDLLKICAQLCAQHGVDFSSLLQEKSQNHTALYWAIVNGSWPPRGPFELVAAVLTHSAPLTSKTIREARRACISLRSQEMFQFLRMRPELGALPEEDQFLLGTLVPPEEIVVEEMDGPTEPFSVKFRIPQFLKRMSLSRKITLEFIARGRLWELSFFTAVNPTSAWLKNGGWSGSLAIAESSPGTHLEFGLVCLDARPSPPSPPANFWVHCSGDRPLYARNEPGKPENGITKWSWAMFEHDNPCIASDGSVSGVLGAKLRAAKAYTRRSSWPETLPTTADAECIIC